MKQQTRIIPIPCTHPGCLLGLRVLNISDTQITYGCTQGHIKKVARSGQRIPVQGPPPNNAA